uniref:Uncharacterized protein n=1 Tax=Lygus hesperus TaxID=30085 RepID=A0A146LXA0_LYGHE
MPSADSEPPHGRVSTTICSRRWCRGTTATHRTGLKTHSQSPVAVWASSVGPTSPHPDSSTFAPAVAVHLADACPSPSRTASDSHPAPAAVADLGSPTSGRGMPASLVSQTYALPTRSARIHCLYRMLRSST